METQELNEAPASVTYSITSPTGYNALFTIREMSGLELLAKMTSIEKKLNELGYKPQIKMSFGSKEAKPIVYADHVCPSCGSKVVIVETSKGKMEKCETQKYDFKTKTSSGCAYIKWL
jgi:hypothetical protein